MLRPGHPGPKGYPKLRKSPVICRCAPTKHPFVHTISPTGKYPRRTTRPDFCYTPGLWQAPSRGIVIILTPTRDGSSPDLTPIELERTPAAVLAGFFIGLR